MEQMKSDSNDTPRHDDDVLSRTPSDQLVGQQLQAGRVRSGMSVDDVARALKLSTRQVESLENDDWKNLPGKTMIRGFVRNYARLVGLDGPALMSALEGMAMPKSPELRGAVGTPVSMPKEGRPDRRDAFRVLAGLLVLALAVLAYFFLPPDFWQTTVQAFKAASQSNQVAGDTAAESSPAASEAAVPLEQPVAVPSEPPAVSPAAAPEPTPEPASTQVHTPAPNVLKFNFDQPSWVEVRDRNGQIIFSQKNAAGSQREVEGQPPFSVVVGNAAHVTLHYKGVAVDLSKRSKEDVARVTVE